MPEEAGHDSETDAAVASENKRYSTVSHGFIHDHRGPARDIEDQRDVLLPRVLRVRTEADHRQITQVPQIESACAESLHEPGRAKSARSQLLPPAATAGAGGNTDKC